MTPRSTNTEDDLIRRAQAGEPAAFQQLAIKHSESLFRCALTLSRDRQVAEDIAQETLLEAWRSLGRFDGRCRLSTWLYGILRHRYLKAAKRQSRWNVSEWSSENERMTATPDLDADANSQRTEDADRVRQAVAALPMEHRQVIELRFFVEAALDDIAVTLDIPLGTVKSRLHNGLEKLRQQKIAVNLFSSTEESSVR